MKYLLTTLLIFGSLIADEISAQAGIMLTDSSFLIQDEGAVLPATVSEIWLNETTSSGELVLRGNSARLSLNNLQIGSLGGNEMGIDGDIVPYASTTFDLGNNVVGEHWDQVVANTFVTYMPPTNLVSTNRKSLGTVMPSLLELSPASFTYKNKTSQVHFLVDDLMAHLPEVLVYEDIDMDSDRQVKKVDDSPGINYDAFIPVLVKAIQEQQAMINSLKNELETLTTNLK